MSDQKVPTASYLGVRIHVTEAAGDKVYVIGRCREHDETVADWIRRAVGVIDVGRPVVEDRCARCGVPIAQHSPVGCQVPS